MTASLQAQVMSLAGTSVGSTSIQSNIKAQLVGVDLSAFSPGEATAEAVARRDPGAAQATLTFTKTGQTLPLPTELAKALIGQAYGSAAISVEAFGRDDSGAVSASLKRISALASPAEAPADTPSSSSVAARFSLGAQALSASSTSIPLGTPSQWANLVQFLTPDMPPELAKDLYSWLSSLPKAMPPSAQALSSGPIETPAAAFSQSLPTQEPPPQAMQLSRNIAETLSQIVPGSGAGFERSIADLSTRGPHEQERMASLLDRFPQASNPSSSQSPQWIAQQASALHHSEILWQGQAWGGAAAWLAVGTAQSRSDHAEEVRAQLGPQAADSLAWIRMRLEPMGLGPVDLWAALLGAGRCCARLRAPESAKTRLQPARNGFSRLLESARVDLRIDYDGPTSSPPPRNRPLDEVG